MLQHVSSVRDAHIRFLAAIPVFALFFIRDFLRGFSRLLSSWASSFCTAPISNFVVCPSGGSERRHPRHREHRGGERGPGGPGGHRGRDRRAVGGRRRIDYSLLRMSTFCNFGNYIFWKCCARFGRCYANFGYRSLHF